jgi:hypothetical protein
MYFLCVTSQGLADNCVVAKVNGEVWDLDRPFEKDSELVLLKFDDPDGMINQNILHFYRCRIIGLPPTNILVFEYLTNITTNIRIFEH